MIKIIKQIQLKKHWKITSAQAKLFYKLHVQLYTGSIMQTLVMLKLKHALHMLNLSCVEFHMLSFSLASLVASKMSEDYIGNTKYSLMRKRSATVDNFRTLTDQNVSAIGFVTLCHK